MEKRNCVSVLTPLGRWRDKDFIARVRTTEREGQAGTAMCHRLERDHSKNVPPHVPRVLWHMTLESKAF